MSFHHNQLACLLSIASAYMLYIGLKSDKGKYFVWAGIFFGINIFSRLSDVAMAVMVLALVPYALYNNWTCAFRKFGLCVLGCLIGITFVIVLMLCFGHFDIFINAIKDVASAGSDPQSNHNVSAMLSRYKGNYVTLTKIAVYMFALPAIALILSRKKSSVSRQKVGSFVLYVLLALISVWSFISIYRLESVYAFLTVVLIVAIIIYHDKKEIVYACILALLMCHTQYIGSDFGFSNMGSNSLFLAFPLAVGMCAKIVCSLYKQDSSRIVVGAMMTVFALIFMSKGVKAQLVHSTYYEDSPRWTMFYKPNAKLATTLVANNNKLILDSALTEVNKYVHKDDYLLCLETLPMINYLTETRPYLGNPWVWTFDPANLKLHIAKSEKNIKTLPVIIWGKGKLCKYYEYDPLWNDANANDDYTHNNRRIALYQSFVRRHHYHKAWENGHFLIMLPPEK